jgi:hypothetical protein
MNATGEDRFDVSFKLTAADYRAMMRAYWPQTNARRFRVWFLIATPSRPG